MTATAKSCEAPRVARLNLPYREWSKAATAGSLPQARRWLRETEAVINQRLSVINRELMVFGYVAH
jgi:hypothetical protein